MIQTREIYINEADRFSCWSMRITLGKLDLQN